jgi:hypothetical protein
MFSHHLSPAVSSRPATRPAPDGPGRSEPSSTDQRVLGLLGEHSVLTTGQLVRLTRLPERTVQHRLSRLQRPGLVNRHRPQVPVGTAPYHDWLTGFGAAVVGAGPPESWSEDPAGLQATAVLSELWRGVRDRGPEVGLYLIGWRRLRDGLTWCDPDTGAVRQLPVEAELRVGLGGEVVTALVLVRVERVPAARLVAVLSRFAAYLAAAPATMPRPVLLVLARTERLAAGVDAACGQVVDTPSGRRLGRIALDAASGRVAVGVVEPRPAGLVSEAVWRTPVAPDEAHRLVDVLGGTLAGGR